MGRWGASQQIRRAPRAGSLSREVGGLCRTWSGDREPRPPAWLSEAAEGSTPTQRDSSAVSRGQEVLSLFQDVLTPVADGPAAVRRGPPAFTRPGEGLLRIQNPQIRLTAWAQGKSGAGKSGLAGTLEKGAAGGRRPGGGHRRAPRSLGSGRRANPRTSPRGARLSRQPAWRGCQLRALPAGRGTELRHTDGGHTVALSRGAGRALRASSEGGSTHTGDGNHTMKRGSN